MRKEKIKLDDGRKLIYYRFTRDQRRGGFQTRKGNVIPSEARNPAAQPDPSTSLRVTQERK